MGTKENPYGNHNPGLAIGYRQAKEKIAELTKIIENLEKVAICPSTSGVVLRVYTISRHTKTKLVVCQHCYDKGEVDSSCNVCGGKGVHQKGYKFWVVNPQLQDIIKITRLSGGIVRLWTNASECYYSDAQVNQYYPEHPEGIVFAHFCLAEAQAEVDRLNKMEQS